MNRSMESPVATERSPRRGCRTAPLDRETGQTQVVTRAPSRRIALAASRACRVTGDTIDDAALSASWTGTANLTPRKTPFTFTGHDAVEGTPSISSTAVVTGERRHWNMSTSRRPQRAMVWSDRLAIGPGAADASAGDGQRPLPARLDLLDLLSGRGVGLEIHEETLAPSVAEEDSRGLSDTRACARDDRNPVSESCRFSFVGRLRFLQIGDAAARGPQPSSAGLSGKDAPRARRRLPHRSDRGAAGPRRPRSAAPYRARTVARRRWVPCRPFDG